MALRLALVLGLAVFTACGGCGDKVMADGRHVACGHGCVEKIENEQKVHNGDKCSCSASCSCMAFPAKKK